MLEHEITGLQHKLLEMAGLVEQMLRQAVESVLTRDKALAQLVVDTDDKIDLLENEIESSCIQLIALHQPVATELRFLTTAMKINHNIERIADKSVAIAKRSIELSEHPPVKPFVDLPYAAQVIQSMVKGVLDAFVNRDAEYALKIRERDSEVDEIYEKMLNELLTILSEHPKLIQPGISLLLLFRHLERIGDLAAHIGEEVYYLVKGDVIRHS
ncbi:MAG: phosphate signaling complex protein PhoU [Candidatus Poribacteria bacterium]|nr:phosphate signaling complex protein PhoU [Candidatus Poribacteria bacterium]MDE0323041.1 phosphate signaling complex protein PhoU [Candidatus Poribacteria bacterium]